MRSSQQPLTSSEAISEYQMLMQLDALTAEAQRRSRGRFIDTLYPDTGPLRRELYAKHMEFFRLGAIDRERAAIAANRVGKTFGLGGYETVLHLTGEYPDWWEGRRFDEPIHGVAAGVTATTTRDIIQSIMVGPPQQPEKAGEWLIPRDKIVDVTNARTVPNAISEVTVRHSSGGVSQLSLRAYEQGRKIFEGVSRHLVWFDEEPPADVWSEGLVRTMTVDGIMMGTFTPLQGISEVVLMFTNPEALGAQAP
jgi:phage terminase large subunit-like protein